MSKCIKCGRELTSAEIPEFYNGMCEKCCKELNCAEYPFKQGINDYQNQIDQLKQQLAEKQNTIDEINKEFVQAVHDWKALCAEKDKEIEKLKQQYTILENENGKLTTELIMGKYKKAQKEVSFGMQLAIQELEKVKEWLEPKYFDYEQINYLTRIIDNQIKELKGE